MHQIWSLCVFVLGALGFVAIDAAPRDSQAAQRLSGEYTGNGAWFDAQGKTMTYVIRHRIAATATGFTVEFTHDFADQSKVHAELQMSWVAPYLFRLDLAARTVGHGYCFGDECNYHIRTGERFVEVSYRRTPNGLEVLGSSSTNADGNYIAWRETLQRR